MDIDSDDDLPLAKALKKSLKRSLGIKECCVSLHDDVMKMISVKKTVANQYTVTSNNTKTTATVENTCSIESMDLELNKLSNEPSSGNNSSVVDVLYEYKWPINKAGEFYHIFEQLAKFLSVDISDKRLEDLETRFISQDEVNLLKTEGILDSLSNTTAIKVVKTEDVFLLMAETFPKAFKIYIKLVHQKEMKKLVRTQEMQRVKVLKGNIPTIMKRSLKETVKFNKQLNQERMDERQAYFDLQTQIIHLPQKKRKYDPDYKPTHSKYPVALMPGQYQDYYKRYTSEELKLLPLNTVTGKLPQKSKELKTNNKEVSENEEEDEGETESHHEGEVDDNDSIAEKSLQKRKKEKDPFCGICMKGAEMNRQGIPEKLVHCSQCENSGHPSCLELNRHIVQVIQTYPWQCMECKICTECLAPHDEESMMFCDNCDRGYHSYCVGVKEIPKGRWVCVRCGKCSSCLAINPVPDGGPGRWKNEATKAMADTEPEFLQIHCHPCSKLFRKGSFCPVCLKVYRASEDHINPMVCCDACDRWIHTDCDGIDEDRYMELSRDRGVSYTCVLCRGDKEERMDAFHRKNR